MKVNVNVVLFSLILKNLVAICQLQDNKLSILTVVSTEFGAENYTWFFLAIFELDMAFFYPMCTCAFGSRAAVEV